VQVALRGSEWRDFKGRGLVVARGVARMGRAQIFRQPRGACKGGWGIMLCYRACRSLSCMCLDLSEVPVLMSAVCWLGR
jgi:hypothetical protein